MKKVEMLWKERQVYRKWRTAVRHFATENLGLQTKGGPVPPQGNGAKYCLDLVKKSDFENYLSTLLLKKSQRRQAFAIRALNVELAKCGSIASEEQLMRMRLRFWQDSIDNCLKPKKGYVEDQPVLKELKMILEANPLTKTHIKRLITARERPLNQPFMSLKQLENYAEQSSSSVLHCLIQLANIKDVDVDHAASHLGKAQGLTNMLRSIPYTGRQQATCIPQEILIKHGVSQERIIRSNPHDIGARDCVFEVASAANSHLEKSRELKEKIPKDLRRLFLPAVALGRYLERLRKEDFILTSPSCMERDRLLPLAIFLHCLRNSF